MSGLSSDIAENERQQEMAQENFDKISKIIKKEVRLISFILTLITFLSLILLS